MNLFSPRLLRTAAIALMVIGLIVLALGGYLNPLIRTATTPFITVQGWVSSRFMAIYDFLTVPRDVASLRQRNLELESQVSQLQTQVIELQQKVAESNVLYALLDFATKRPENEYAAAAVIGRDPNPFMRYILIDRGSDDGLRHGMPVVTQQGLVGRIDTVFAGASRVQLITDPSSTVNIRLQSSTIEALLKGSLTGDLSLDMLPRDAVVSVGDVVLTSGLGGNYPSNIFIGQVLSVRIPENALFKAATIQPAVDFAGLKAVLVITNFTPVNLTPLEPMLIP
jgi:rod shape-determining protein MreC